MSDKHYGHKVGCNEADRPREWSGSPNPENPDNEWVCDQCGGVISADDEATYEFNQIVLALTLEQAECLHNWLRQITKQRPYGMSEAAATTLNSIADMVEDVIVNEGGVE